MSTTYTLLDSKHSILSSHTPVWLYQFVSMQSEKYHNYNLLTYDDVKDCLAHMGECVLNPASPSNDQYVIIKS